MKNRSTLLAIVVLIAMVLGMWRHEASADERAIKVAPTETPILTIDSGGHLAMIKDVIFTRDGKYLLSASDDKTVRVWDVATGEVVRVLRGQIGEGSEGKIHAAALSPDNRWLAVGGMFHNNNPIKGSVIRLIDFHTGEVVRLLRGHENVILGLAFSPDSTRLISGSGDSTARIWNVATGKSLRILSGHTDDIYAVAFSPDGKKAVTGSDDDTLRLWNSETGKQIATLTGHQDNVVSAAFTPDGKYILSSSDDKTIRLWNGKTGKFVKVLASQNRTVDSLSISPDSKSVLTGHGSGAGERANNIFSIPDSKKRLSFTRHNNIVLATAISPDGRVAATGGGDDQAIYLWDIRTGEVRQKLVSKGKAIWSVGFGRDGRAIAWGKTWEQANLFERGKLEQSFHLNEAGEGFRLSLGEELKNDDGFIRGVESVGNISIRTKGHAERSRGISPTLQILRNGTVRHEIIRGSTDGQDHRSLTLTPDGKTAISGGSNGNLTSYDTQTGDKRCDFVGHTSDVFGVAVSPDGKWLVSGSADQTVRLWNIATGKNLLTIFHSSDNEWVAWTPEGYYDSSLNGDKYIGWHINRGEENSALFYPASRFADKFRKPLVVAKYLETNGNISRAIALANAEDPKRQQTTETDFSQITRILPPAVFFQKPSERDVETSEELFCVKAGARSLTNEPIKDIWLTLDGKEQARSVKRIKNKKQPTQPVKQLMGKKASVEQCLLLNSGENRISVFASAGDSTSEPETIRITRKVAPSQRPETTEDLFRPDLYLLSIGISQYQNSDYDLNVAHKDAEAVAAAFREQKGKLYKNVAVKLLTNEKATGDNILDGLDWILKESTQRDVSVIFIAGHGVNDEANNYYFMPYEADEKRLRRTGVKWFDFQDVVQRLPSKTLFLADTCHSGNITGTRRRGFADITEALRELVSTTSGVIVMTAATGSEFSIEKKEWGHGAFTKAIVEGLRDFRADYDQNRQVEIKELDLFVTKRVKELTNGRQHPTTEIPKTMPNFPIAVK